MTARLWQITGVRSQTAPALPVLLDPAAGEDIDLLEVFLQRLCALRRGDEHLACLLL